MQDFRDDVADYHLSDFNDLKKDLEIWLERFIEEKNLLKVSSKTIKSYKNALAPFLRFCELHKNQMSMENISARFINRYFIWYQHEIAVAASLRNKKNLPLLEQVKEENKKKTFGKNDALFKVFEAFENTLSHRQVVLKDFLKFITENNKNNKDYVVLFDKFCYIKIHEKMTHHLTVSEIQKVLDEMHKWPDTYKSVNRKPKSSERYAYRDSLLVMLYCLTGARSEEIVYVKLKDISYENSAYTIKIEKGKGGKKRAFRLREEDTIYIKKHLNYMMNELPSMESYISTTFDLKINSYTQKPMNADSIRRFDNFVLKLLNINKSGLHATRRGYATKRIAQDGIDISTVAKELGNTTAILEKHYYKHSAEVY